MKTQAVLETLHALIRPSAEGVRARNLRDSVRGVA